MKLGSMLFLQLFRQNKNFIAQPTSSKKVLIFDIDRTLYPATPKINNYSKHIYADIANKAGIKGDTLANCSMYKAKYGSQIKGLLVENKEIDRESLVNYIEENTDVSQFITKDDKLIELLESLKEYQMYCFTNGVKKCAIKILDKLEITRFFDGVFYPDYRNKQEIICKPDIQAYTFVESVLRTINIVFFDDMKENINVGLIRGWDCKLVTETYDICEALEDFIESEQTYKECLENVGKEISSREKQDCAVLLN